jgi:NAD(P)-dependent dehydrogenase (short-subunit alcohol dehydrogenase family)
MMDLTGTTAVVTGASRGFGRATADALAAAGATVVGVARTAGADVVGDAADPALAAKVLAEHRPGILVLNAGATPASGPLHELSWEDFSRPWEVDVRQAFGWLGEALRLPLAPGSSVVVVSSGAAVRGSPVSGGYAGAKATVRFLAAYAADESRRAGLGIRFTAVLPGLNPAGGIGATGVAAYAARQGVDVPTFLDRLGPTPSLAEVGGAIATLAADPAYDREAYQLESGGLTPLD